MAQEFRPARFAGVLLSTFALSTSLYAGVVPAQAAEDAPKTMKQVVDQNAKPATVAKETDRFVVGFKTKDKATRQQTLQKTDQRSTELKDVTVVKNKVAADDTKTVIQTKKPLDKAEQQKVVEQLKADPAIDFVEPDPMVNAVSAAPVTEPYYPLLWHFDQSHLNAAAAWNQGVNGAGQTVGIVDTGWSAHPDLKAPVSQYDFVSTSDLSRDGDGRDGIARDEGNGNYGANWHGTFVDGEIAAKVNDIGVAGLAYGANVSHARALGWLGNGYVSDIADAITWEAGGAVDGAPINPRPATVINASLAYPDSQCNYVMSSAVNYALSKNIPVVVAAGNDGANADNYSPANCYRAIVVGATTSWNTLTAYSNYGSMLDVVAPGGTSGSDMYSTMNTGFDSVGQATYGTKNGTSMATPLVSATVALMKQAYPAISVEQIRQILVNTGTPMDGYRQINPGAAVKAAKALNPAPAPAQQITMDRNTGIGATYYRYGGSATFGEPTTREFAVKDGGVTQQFSKNYNIYWHPQFGAEPVNWSGAIGVKYRADGYEGTYGFPRFREVNIPGGAMQKFTTSTGRTSAFYWTSTTGARVVKEYGAIGGKFTAEGGTVTYGFPNEDEVDMGNGGVRQIFSDGSLINRFYWSPGTGAHNIKGHGAIYAYWLSQGGLNTDGYPVTDEISAGNGGVVQYFRDSNGGETGYYWSPASGTHKVNSKGAIYFHWLKNGYTRTLGYPVTDETTHADGSATVKFSSGVTLRWTANGGVQQIR